MCLLVFEGAFSNFGAVFSDSSSRLFFGMGGVFALRRRFLLFVSSFFEGASSFFRCCYLLVFSFFVLRGEGVVSFRTWFLVFVFLFVAERLLNSVPYWTTIG